MLGYDMKVDHANHQSHWHDGFYPPPMGFDEVDHYVNTFSASFEELAELIYQAGIKVINLNPDSVLPYFPKASAWTRSNARSLPAIDHNRDSAADESAATQRAKPTNTSRRIRYGWTRYRPSAGRKPRPPQE
ncbi:MAG: hypothetical protein R3F37_02455 [Candidatus Competibacteraceae bacterium]